MSTDFVPANLLEIALKDAVTDPAARPRFLAELLESKILIVPAGEPSGIVNGVAQENSKISLANVAIEGRQCVPFFTSESRLPAGTKYLMLDARAFFEMTRGAHLVMNPGAGYGKEFFPEEVARLLVGPGLAPKEHYVAKKDEKVLIGQPAEYPTELVAALSRFYATKPAVKRAWVAFCHNPARDAEGGLLIALDVATPDDMERISAETGLIVESTPRNQKYVDLIRYDGVGVTGYFTAEKPFYQQGSAKSWWQKLVGQT
jgi:hypothetical protein